FFLRRRRAFSTGSPFFSLISVNSIHILPRDLGKGDRFGSADTLQSSPRGYFPMRPMSTDKNAVFYPFGSPPAQLTSVVFSSLCPSRSSHSAKFCSSPSRGSRERTTNTAQVVRFTISRVTSPRI